jgi:hypothetical protein
MNLDAKLAHMGVSRSMHPGTHRERQVWTGPYSSSIRMVVSILICSVSASLFHQSSNSSVNSTSQATTILFHLETMLSRDYRSARSEDLGLILERPAAARYPRK